MVVADFEQKGQICRKPNKMFKWMVVNTGCAEEFFFSLFNSGFAGMPLSVSRNELREWSVGTIHPPSHADQSALFDGEADVKQLPSEQLVERDAIGQWSILWSPRQTLSSPRASKQR